MIVLALDPGSTETGYVVFDSAPGANQVIIAKDILANHLMLSVLYDFADCVDHCVIEDMKPHPMQTKDGHTYIAAAAIEVQRYMGRLIERWLIVSGREPALLPRPAVTKHLHANKRGKGSKDSQVTRSLMDRFGPKGTKTQPGQMYGMKSHMWAALGVAVTFADTQPIADF